MDTYIEQYKNKITVAKSEIKYETTFIPSLGFNEDFYRIVFNGFLSPIEYNADLYNSQKLMIREIKATAKKIDGVQNKIDYLEKAFDELEELKFIVWEPNKEKPNSFQHKYLDGEYELSDSFNEANEPYPLNKLQSYLKICFDSVISSVESLKDLITNVEKLNTFSALTNRPIEPTGSGVEKIKTSLSVDELAAFLRLMIDTKLIDSDKSIAFARFIAKNFSTKKQADLSPDSLKNKILDPDPKAIESIRIHASNLVKAAKDFDK